jgi:hypothetical protein
MLARRLQSRRASSIAALRGCAGPDLEALTVRRRVDSGMTIARLAYDDDDGAVRGSAPDEESNEEGSDSSLESCVFTVLCMYAGG